MTRIAIVTGASSGLGKEFVKHIDAGASGQIDEIWVVARRLERLKALQRTCGTPVRPFCLDLTDPASFEVIEGALGQTPGAEVALLVNNAGFGVFGNVAMQDKRDGGAMVRLLMQAPVELIYRALPYLRRGSRIINIASVAAFLPPTQSRGLLGSQAVHPRSIALARRRARGLRHPCDRGLPQIHADGVPRCPGRRDRRPRDDDDRIRARRPRGRPGPARIAPRTIAVHSVARHEGILRRVARTSLQDGVGRRAGAGHHLTYRCAAPGRIRSDGAHMPIQPDFPSTAKKEALPAIERETGRAYCTQTNASINPRESLHPRKTQAIPSEGRAKPCPHRYA